MKGLYWLVIGLCVWFVPFIVIEFLTIYQDPEKTTGEVLEQIPLFAIYALLVTALGITIKGVITLRHERKIQESEKQKKRKSKK